MLKTLYFDIETSPCLGWFWKPGYNLNLDYNNVINNAKIICICYKWAGDKKVYSLNWDRKQNDKKMLQDFIKVLDKADQIVGHNSDRFDIRWIRTRCIDHKIKMMPEYVSIDTLKEAKKGFYFPSNRLDSIGRYLGEGKKIKTTGELWFDVWRKNSQVALKKMVDYCKQDVILLEQIHQRMLIYTKPKMRISTDITECPRCESDDLRPRKYGITAAGVRFVQLQCHKCGTYHKVNDKRYSNTKTR